jgi:hypothetical protein
MEEQNATASKLQAMQRGRAARKEAAEQKKTASKIQAMQRGRAARREAQQQQASAQRIQAIQRGKTERAARKERQRACVAGAAGRSLSSRGACGTQPMSAGACLARVDASGAGLEGLGALGEAYGHVQQLDVSNNKITTLKPLSKLHFLHTLDVSGNRLVRVLDFETPHHSFDPKAASHVGSTLLHANLSQNWIEMIDPMLALRHPRLISLTLDNNKISSLQGLVVPEGLATTSTALVFLRTLSVRNNNLENLEGIAAAPNLQRLHADGNKRLRSLQALSGTPDLLELTLSGSAIEDLDGVDKCERLHTLDMSDNRLDSINALAPLMDLARLNNLTVIRGNNLAVRANPNATPFELRHSVLFRLPHLTVLDNEYLASEDKVKARVSHGADVEQRQKGWQAALPEVPWINMTPPQPE